MREGQNDSQSIKFLFHRTYWVMALGFVLTGHYLNLLVFTSLILVHELGHCLLAWIQGLRVLKIVIYPFGGITKLDVLVNLDLYQELIVACYGVIMQFLFYLLVCFLHHQGLIRDYTMDLYTLYNGQMIFFNLLPVYPLDGGRIFNLLFSRYFCFSLANDLTILVSLMTIFFLIIFSVYRCNYSNVMIIFILFTYLWKFYQKRKYLYQRFLVERYLYSFEYPKIKIVESEKKMYKNRTHVFRVGKFYMREKVFLRRVFRDFNRSFLEDE